jgi:hypothetical protein
MHVSAELDGLFEATKTMENTRTLKQRGRQWKQIHFYIVGEIKVSLSLCTA